MDIFNSKSSPQQPQDLKSLVESLQQALHNHKHHIAVEVRNNLLSEFSLSFSSFSHSISQKLTESTSALEHLVKLNSQTLSHKIQSLESNIEQLSAKLSALSTELSSLSRSHSSNLLDTKEKLLNFELQSENFKQNLKNLQNFSSSLESQLESLSASLVKNGVSVLSSVQTVVKQQVEAVQFECLNRINAEVSKFQDKVFGVHLQQVEKGFASASIQPDRQEKGENDEVFKTVNKCLMSIGSLRIRVEKLENSEQICEMFRKSITQI